MELPLELSKCILLARRAKRLKVPLKIVFSCVFCLLGTAVFPPHGPWRIVGPFLRSSRPKYDTEVVL